MHFLCVEDNECDQILVHSKLALTNMAAVSLFISMFDS